MEQASTGGMPYPTVIETGQGINQALDGFGMSELQLGVSVPQARKQIQILPRKFVVGEKMDQGPAGFVGFLDLD